MSELVTSELSDGVLILTQRPEGKKALSGAITHSRRPVENAIPFARKRLLDLAMNHNCRARSASADERKWQPATELRRLSRR